MDNQIKALEIDQKQVAERLNIKGLPAHERAHLRVQMTRIQSEIKALREGDRIKTQAQRRTQARKGPGAPSQRPAARPQQPVKPGQTAAKSPAQEQAKTPQQAQTRPGQRPLTGPTQSSSVTQAQAMKHAPQRPGVGPSKADVERLTAKPTQAQAQTKPTQAQTKPTKALDGAFRRAEKAQAPSQTQTSRPKGGAFARAEAQSKGQEQGQSRSHGR